MDLAVDLTTATAAEAQHLAKHFYLHLTQRWHGKRVMNRHMQTLYAHGAAKTTRNTVVYADKPARHTWHPCCHLELRLYGAAACRRRGLNNAGALRTVDHRAIWQHELRLERVDLAKVEKNIARRARAALKAKHTHQGHAFSRYAVTRQCGFMARRLAYAIDDALPPCLRPDPWAASFGEIAGVPVQLLKEQQEPLIKTALAGAFVPLPCAPYLP